MSYRYYNVVDLIQPFMTDDLVPFAYKEHTQTILSALSAKAISMYGHSGFDEPNILKQDADEGEPYAESLDNGLILVHATLLSGGYAGDPAYENPDSPLPVYTYTQSQAFFIAAFQYLCYSTPANEHIETILGEIKYTCVCDYSNKYNIVMNAILALTNPKFSFIPDRTIDWYFLTAPSYRFEHNLHKYLYIYPVGLTFNEGPFGVDAQEQSVATIIRNRIPVYQLPKRLQNYILNDVRLVWSKTKVSD